MYIHSYITSRYPSGPFQYPVWDLCLQFVSLFCLLIIDTDGRSVYWCSWGSSHDNTSGKYSGIFLWPAPFESCIPVRSTAVRTRPVPAMNCCRCVPKCHVCLFCHCRNRSWVTFQNTRGPGPKGVYVLGSPAPGGGGRLDGTHGCCLCWRTRLGTRHRNGPSGSLPLHGSWAVSSSMFAQYRTQTSHDTCTLVAFLMRLSVGRGMKMNVYCAK